MDLVKLKNEVVGDPLGRGYAGMDDETIARSLAVVNRQLNRETIDGGLLVSCVVKSEYVALTNNDKDWIKLLAATATPIPISATLRSDLGSTFSAGSATRPILVAALKRPCSRAEELELGGIPTPSDIANAKRLP